MNDFEEVVNKMVDIMWRTSHYHLEWKELTPEQQTECVQGIAADIEGQFLRMGDIYRGCSPLEYLQIKEDEQEAFKKEMAKAERQNELSAGRPGVDRKSLVDALAEIYDSELYGKTYCNTIDVLSDEERNECIERYRVDIGEVSDEELLEQVMGKLLMPCEQQALEHLATLRQVVARQY